MALHAQWFLAWSLTPKVGPAAIASYASELLPPEPETVYYQQAEQLFEQAADRGERLIGQHDPDYPSQLLSCRYPPPVIWVNGQLPSRPQLAIIGTRSPHPQSITAAQWTARCAIDNGWSTISGGARGIDIAAHRVSYEHTVCVLGSGLGCVYPREHQSDIASIIADGGCVVSEYPRDTVVHPGQLIARDRIVAAWADAVVPIQAGARSGTMHTVKVAQELHRPLGVWDAHWTEALEELPATKIRRSTLEPWLRRIQPKPV